MMPGERLSITRIEGRKCESRESPALRLAEEPSWCSNLDLSLETRQRHDNLERGMNRIFLLSPADCGGKRASMILRSEAEFELASRLREREGVPIGELFSFLSGLYFRGKLAYSVAFSIPPTDVPGVLVITPNKGMVPANYMVDHSTLQEFSASRIKISDDKYRGPLERDALRISEQIGSQSNVVLLGSLATDKYLEVLKPIFGDRLKFPAEFVGRGDMSRGALLLKCVKEGRELSYIGVDAI